MGRSCWILMTAIHFYVLVHVCFDNEFLLKPVKTKKVRICDDIEKSKQ